MQLDVYNMAGAVVGQTELLDSVFGLVPNTDLLHQAVVRHLANARQGTAATKTRGMVSGGGKKPFRQKGTGHARQGTTRAPHYRGGGVVFGPHPRDYHQDMPKKMRRAALKSALSALVQDGRIRLLDSLEFAEPKTKEAVQLLRNLTINDKSVLVVTTEVNQIVYRTVRNIPKSRIMPESDINAYDVLKYDYLLMPVEAAKRIESRLSASEEFVLAQTEGTEE